MAEATADVALVRFHGRNAEMWERRGASVADRFNYLYSEDELREWVSPIERLASAAREVHVLMNNCVSDKAVVNAAQVRMLLCAQESASFSTLLRLWEAKNWKESAGGSADYLGAGCG